MSGVKNSASRKRATDGKEKRHTARMTEHAVHNSRLSVSIPTGAIGRHHHALPETTKMQSGVQLMPSPFEQLHKKSQRCEHHGNAAIWNADDTVRNVAKAIETVSDGYTEDDQTSDNGRHHKEVV
jgi:hypothetical protein